MSTAYTLMERDGWILELTEHSNKLDLTIETANGNCIVGIYDLQFEEVAKIAKKMQETVAFLDPEVRQP